MREALDRVKASVKSHGDKHPTSKMCFPRDAETYERYPLSIPEK